MPGLRVVRWGPERIRVGSWRGYQGLAYLAPVAETPPASVNMVRHCCALLAGQGYTEVVTGALGSLEQRSFLQAGFEVREELHLLSRSLRDLPAASPAPLRRAHRRDRERLLIVDALAFPSFWRLDDAGMAEALSATRSARLRVAAEDEVLGYAISGRSGTRGYLQRLAVDPAAQGRGFGYALVVDGLRWMRRHGVDRVVVNTQVGNERALRLYHGLGFSMEPSGLAVLACRLEDCELTS
ncbi:MAG TPA: GNAT family N-acetyltransferase [Acidimicrobiales bacterium]|nr:GNAT family N-acetyltransferase [Acidimicrobiales bacterium]